MLLKVLRTARAIKNKKARAKKTFWRRAAKNKKNISSARARTFQCDNKFKTELTAKRLREKKSTAEKEKYLSNVCRAGGVCGGTTFADAFESWLSRESIGRRWTSDPSSISESSSIHRSYEGFKPNQSEEPERSWI